MENPNTWTPLHRAIHLAFYDEKCTTDAQLAERIAVVISQHSKKSLDLKEIEEVIATHNREMNEHLCGLSLPSKVVNRLRLK